MFVIRDYKGWPAFWTLKVWTPLAKLHLAYLTQLPKQTGAFLAPATRLRSSYRTRSTRVRLSLSRHNLLFIETT